MKDYKARIEECMEHLNAIRFPGADWTEDKTYYDQLEREFAQEPADAQTKALWERLRALIRDKRASSLNRNKTTEELFAGWND